MQRKRGSGTVCHIHKDRITALTHFKPSHNDAAAGLLILPLLPLSTSLSVALSSHPWLNLDPLLLGCGSQECLLHACGIFQKQPDHSNNVRQVKEMAFEDGAFVRKIEKSFCLPSSHPLFLHPTSAPARSTASRCRVLTNKINTVDG